VVTCFAVLVGAVIWNMTYFWFIKTFNYSAGIFRLPVQTPQTPLYGLSQLTFNSQYNILVSAAFILSVVVILLYKVKLKDRFFTCSSVGAR